MDNNIRNNRESKMQENIKLDSNGDEIIWELERNINPPILKPLAYLSILWSYSFRFILIGLGVFTIYLAFFKVGGWRTILLFLFAILMIYAVGGSLLQSLNCKTIYLTKKNLCIKRYIGSDITLCLGCFIIYRLWIRKLSFDDDYAIELFECNKRIYEFLDCLHTNIDEIYPILKPYILDYLLKCNEKSYYKFQLHYSKPSILYKYDIDYKEIDKLRKEKEKNG